MQEAKITITVYKTDKGNIRIKFPDGGDYLLKDVPDNWGLISALEVYIEWANKPKEPTVFEPTNKFGKNDQG